MSGIYTHTHYTLQFRHENQTNLALILFDLKFKHSHEFEASRVHN